MMFRSANTASNVSFKAAVCMTIAMAFFATMGIFIRLSSETLHTLEIVFFRNALALVFFFPFIAKNGLAVLNSKRKKLYGARALINVTGMAAGFAALTMIPLAEATALSFTAPLFATFAAAIIFGEIIRIRRIIALMLGFLGMLFILQPGVNEISTGSILAIINAVTIAITVLIVKKLTNTERPEIIVIYMALFQTPLALIPAMFFWKWPDLMTWVWLIALATAGTLGHLFYTKAIQLAEVSQMQPIEFIRLPIVAGLAFFLFGEIPTFWTWVGGAIIFSATAYVTHRESKLSKTS
ncbi:MAG: DMT family transporter [Pseudomonadota bacterium]|jgi:drug/metabolite transporter (DMT)-like permease|nr:hypothetical protein [Rhodospirillaceae bacterium]MEC7973029.1 DMT family transporter [Pseudomonadota bacterium]